MTRKVAGLTGNGPMTLFFAVTAVLFLLFFPSLASAEKSAVLLEEVRFHQAGKTEETITFRLNGEQAPRIFTIKGEAPKIVFDFYDTDPAPAIKARIQTKGNLVTAIRTGVHRDGQHKTRVVLDLAPAGRYDFSQDFDATRRTLRITVFQLDKPGERPQKPPPPEVTHRDADTLTPTAPMIPAPAEKDTATVTFTATEDQKVPPSPSPPMTIHAIEFSRDQDREEKLSIRIDHFQPPEIAAIEEGTPKVICTFSEAVLADRVPAVIPTKGRYIHLVQMDNDPDAATVRITLELTPNHHYDLKQIYFREEKVYVLLISASGQDEKTTKQP